MLGATLEQVMTQSVADMTIVEALAAGESTTVAAERAVFPDVRSRGVLPTRTFAVRWRSCSSGDGRLLFAS
jgi:hypothetical protein